MGGGGEDAINSTVGCGQLCVWSLNKLRWHKQGFVNKGINHTAQIFLTRPSEWRILCTSWLQSPGQVSCREVNIWVTRVELRGPILSAQAWHQLSICCTRAVRQKFSTPDISELSVQNRRDSGKVLSKDRYKTTSSLFVIPPFSQLWEKKNYCERRNELSSWRPVAFPNHHIHLRLVKLRYDVLALLSGDRYILSGENLASVYSTIRRRRDQNNTQVDNRQGRARTVYVRLLHLTSMDINLGAADPCGLVENTTTTLVVFFLIFLLRHKT